MRRRRGRRALRAPDGRVVVRDESLPGARVLRLDMPDGTRIRIAEHGPGWSGGRDPWAGAPRWATVAEAVEAQTGRDRAREPWISVLEELATPLAGSAAVPLPAEEEDRLSALAGRAPGLRVDGPHPHGSGGWYLFLGGLPDGAWAMGHAATPAAAARAAIDRAETLLKGP